MAGPPPPPPPELRSSYGTAPCPRNTLTNREFVSHVARRSAAEITEVTAEEKVEEGTPWFELRLPWEKEPPFWRHPILSNRWRRMHYRILSLERSLGIHSRWHEDVLPWCPERGGYG